MTQNQQPALRLPQAPWMSASDTCAVVAALTREGDPARFVGGCVRDTLLGRGVSDIDLATPAEPQRVMELLQAAGIKAIPTGIAHGTVTAVVDGKHFEITTLRRDVETDGRHAKVAFTDDWTADAARRDFTMNAISADPDGTIHDPFGGVADLHARRVRFVGDAEQRIREDVLRLLRFFRFQAHYGVGAPDPAGLDACRRLGPLLPGLSGERIAGETIKLLRAPDPAPVVALMVSEGIWLPILPQISNVARLAALVKIESEVAAGDPIRRLAALLPADRAAVEVLAERIRLSNAERDRLCALAAPEVAVEPDAAPQIWHRDQRRVGDAAYADVVMLAWAQAVAKGDTARAVVLRQLWEHSRAWVAPPFPLKGRDALDAGVSPGPAVGQLLAQVEAWWEEGDYGASPEECLAKLRALAAS
jgi:poly(A) polymerase